MLNVKCPSTALCNRSSSSMWECVVCLSFVFTGCMLWSYNIIKLGEYSSFYSSKSVLEVLIQLNGLCGNLHITSKQHKGYKFRNVGWKCRPT